MAISNAHDAEAQSKATPQQQCITQQASPHASEPSLPRSTSPFSSPSVSLDLQSYSTPQPIHIADISYPESYLRTPIPQLPFPHPKYHVKPSTGEIYEVTSPLFEEYDPEIGYLDGVGDVRESIEQADVKRERRASGEWRSLRKEGKRAAGDGSDGGGGDAARKKTRKTH